MRRVLAPASSNISPAADIILLVDESGSMMEEHAWIPTMTALLDQALMEVGVGEEPKNRYVSQLSHTSRFGGGFPRFPLKPPFQKITKNGAGHPADSANNGLEINSKTKGHG
jgi:hypothetical protein